MAPSASSKAPDALQPWDRCLRTAPNRMCLVVVTGGGKCRRKTNPKARQEGNNLARHLNEQAPKQIRDEAVLVQAVKDLVQASTCSDGHRHLVLHDRNKLGQSIKFVVDRLGWKVNVELEVSRIVLAPEPLVRYPKAQRPRIQWTSEREQSLIRIHHELADEELSMAMIVKKLKANPLFARFDLGGSSIHNMLVRLRRNGKITRTMVSSRTASLEAASSPSRPTPQPRNSSPREPRVPHQVSLGSQYGQPHLALPPESAVPESVAYGSRMALDPQLPEPYSLVPAEVSGFSDDSNPVQEPEHTVAESPILLLQSYAPLSSPSQAIPSGSNDPAYAIQYDAGSQASNELSAECMLYPGTTSAQHAGFPSLDGLCAGCNGTMAAHEALCPTLTMCTGCLGSNDTHIDGCPMESRGWELCHFCNGRTFSHFPECPILFVNPGYPSIDLSYTAE